MATYCIVCGNRRDGLPVMGDHVLDVIRWFKTNVTKNEQGNKLVVCKDCYLKYKKQRGRFETRRILYVGLGLVFAIVSLVVSPRLGTLVAAAALIIFLYLLSLLSYMPRLDTGNKSIRSRK